MVVEHDELPGGPRGRLLAPIFVAGNVVAKLEASWSRPVRHNRKVELAALWVTLDLDQSCRSTLLAPEHDVPLVPYYSTEKKLDLVMGAIVVDRILPFQPDEREALRSGTFERDLFFKTGAVVDEQPALVERWHEWLWTDNPEGRGEQASIPGLILHRACAQLAMWRS